jgi:hypothetical protein
MSNRYYGFGDAYPSPTTNDAGAVVAGQRLSVGASTVSFATAFNKNTDMVLIEVQGNGIFVTFDGSVPSATNGFGYGTNTREMWSKQRATRARFIQQSGAAFVMASEFTK